MTETVRFECLCGKTLKAEEASRGKHFSCPACGRPVIVPLFDAVQSVSAPVGSASEAYAKQQANRSAKRSAEQGSFQSWVAVITAFMFFFLVFACCLLPMFSPQQNLAPVVQRPTTGNVGHLRVDGGGGVPFATSQAAYDRLVELSVAKDEIGTGQLVIAGLAGMTPTGTQCRVIKTGIFNYEVRLIDGPHAGVLAFVASDFVFSE